MQYNDCVQTSVFLRADLMLLFLFIIIYNLLISSSAFNGKQSVVF